jgi:hypothetical protein
MKKLLVLCIGVLALTARANVARAADLPTKQEGRVWVDQNFVLAFSPNWSLSTMPGARGEFARSREGVAGLQFLELFFGPNYTYRTGDWTIKTSLWYYYMGYPNRGRWKEASDGWLDCTPSPAAGNNCTSTYNFSHNIELIPSVEYRIGRWSLFDRVILHNTFYADVYNSVYTDPNDATKQIGVGDQRLGWGTVLRELIQLRYAVNDKMGVFVADELFFGVIEDGDTSGMKKKNQAGGLDPAGYTPLGYWKSGFRYNRSYLGFDYKVTPNFTIAPSYMIEIGLNPTDSGDITDVAHNLFVVATITALTFDPPKK